MEQPEVQLGEWAYADDHAAFESAAQCIRQYTSPLLEQFFGPRCEDFEPECDCCKRWKMLDELTANPFHP